MTEPATPTPNGAPVPEPAPANTSSYSTLVTYAAPAKPSLTQRLLALLAWARSPRGRHDLGALVAAGVTVYTALHRAGV